ncbi:hypothetical protein Tco_0454361 [Tanacetum coccineum]
MPQRLTKSSIYSRSLGLSACASLESENEVCLLCELGWVSRVDEMILARERSGFAGEKVWDDIQVVPGFVGREMRLLGK